MIAEFSPDIAWKLINKDITFNDTQTFTLSKDDYISMVGAHYSAYIASTDYVL
jgi:hypothetical protein